MKVSLSSITAYLDFVLPETDELVARIGARLGEIEEAPLDLNEVYKDAVIVKVVDCQKLDGSDHLNVCLVDDSNKVEGVSRNSDGLVEVVCGAPNVKAGILAVWLPPGAVVPSTYNADRLVLEAKELRGHVSNGMLASPKELAISDEHEGILVIDEASQPGTSFSELYGLSDVVLNIENKMFTHRPDCFGQLGVAREVAGIFNKAFSSPDWYLQEPEIASDNSVSVKIDNEIPELTPRFAAVVISGLKVEPSPIKVQSELIRLGVRPINNIVDITNLVMLQTGQSLHAYDLAKLTKITGGDVKITVRNPRPSETVKLLSGKEVEPPADSIGIAAGDQLLGLGGIMGGESTEVDGATTAILLEAATFDMFATRRTSMELGVFSEAVTRFTKGQSPLQVKRVLNYATQCYLKLLPTAKVLGAVDDNHMPSAHLKADSLFEPVKLTAEFINSRLGTELAPEEIKTLLNNVEFDVAVQGDTIVVKAPFWRTDIEIREDVVEEVGRLFGYENIAPQLIHREVTATPRNSQLENEAKLRQLLAEAGANELLTYSFVSRRLLESSNQDPDMAFEIGNSLSPELQFYRLSLTPSLLTKVQQNQRAGFERFAVFELGSYHVIGQFSEAEKRLPAEYPSLALVYAANKAEPGAAFFRAKSYLDFLITRLNLPNISYARLSDIKELAPQLEQLSKLFDHRRSAVVFCEGKQCGLLGEYQAKVRTNLKLPPYSAGLEIDSRIFQDANAEGKYQPLSRFPLVKQDITLSVAKNTSYADLNQTLLKALTDLAPKTASYSLSTVSIFEPKDEDSKHFSFRLNIADNQRTLKDSEVNQLLDKLAEAAGQTFKAERVKS